jgi:hypothetical protein
LTFISPKISTAEKSTGKRNSPVLQPDMKISRPSDKYEQEARNAEQAFDTYDSQDKAAGGSPGSDSGNDASPLSFNSRPSSVTTPVISRMSASGDPCQRQVEDEDTRGSFLSSDTASDVQASDADTFSAGSSFEDAVNNPPDRGKPIRDDTRQEMEHFFRSDFSNVRIHDDANAEKLNNDIGSRAFTHGNDIYFNRNEYQPDTHAGQSLLSHELTHTIQQGAGQAGNNPALQSKLISNPSQIQRQTEPAKSVTPIVGKPVDISSRFEPGAETAAFLDEHHNRYQKVPVRLGKIATGTIEVKQVKRAKDATPATYKINSRQALPYLGIDFLNILQGVGIEPVISLKADDPKNISGTVGLKKGKRIFDGSNEIIHEINKNLELLGLLGIKPISAKLENSVTNGIVTLKAGNLKTSIAGYLDADGSFGLVGERFVFELNTHVDIKGLAQGDFKIARNEKGQLSGEGEIAVAIANLNGKVKVTYVAGDVTILGTVGIASEKFTGSVTIMVADSNIARQTMMAALDVKTVEEEKKKEPSPKAAQEKTKKNQVVIGWGTVTARITPWLEGTAKIGVDDKGHVTIVAKIEVPNEVVLMEQKGKKMTLFTLEIKAGYGIPLVGQIGFFASVGMFISAGFGPLVLRNVMFTGTYSTDPSVLQNFMITGTLGISAFAIIGLEAKAGIFLTLIGHDIKAGIKVTAAAGIRAYAEATPTFEYTEKKSPEGGKVGEAWLKGHFEAAAQLFLKLAGAFIVELDSPWWSPAPDKTWEYPLGDVEYPLGPSLGIGGDVAWQVGSDQVPELKFSPVDFDAGKFTSDIMADPPPGKGGGKGGEQKDKGKWEDKTQKGGKEAKPEVKKDNKGLEGKKKDDPSKWPDEKRYMTALGKIGDMGDESKKHGLTLSVVQAKLNKIKQQYRISQVTTRNKKDGSLKVFVKHGKQDNNRNLIEIKLMSESERQKLVDAAKKELQAKQESKADPKAKTLSEAVAKSIAADVAGKHKVVEAIKVVDGKDSWDYELDLGDKKEKVKGKKKADVKVEPTEEEKKKHEEIGETVDKEMSKVEKKDIPYDKLRKQKEKQAKVLEDQYNKKLEKPVVLKISFDPPEKDITDNDLDFHIFIGPNDFKREGAVKAGPKSVKPEVGLYKVLNKISGAKEQEAHHVPPKGLMNWISVEANNVKMGASDHRQKEIAKENPWVFEIADMDSTVYKPGDNLAAINISKYTHIKKTNDEKQVLWRVHFGKETAKEVHARMKEKGLDAIYRRNYEELTEAEKEEYRKLAEEAGEPVPTPDSKKINQTEPEFTATQFFKKELEAASVKETEKWNTEVDKFGKGIGKVAKRAAVQAHLAVTVALEKSDRDGTIAERESALKALTEKSKETWNMVAGINKLNIF